MKALPDTHKAALYWLAEHGGEGVIDQYGRVIAQGEKYKSSETAQVWLRLFTTGHIGSAGPARLGLAPLGWEIAKQRPRNRRDEDHLSARTWGHKPLLVDDDPEEFA